MKAFILVHEDLFLSSLNVVLGFNKVYLRFFEILIKQPHFLCLQRLKSSKDPDSRKQNLVAGSAALGESFNFIHYMLCNLK